MARGRPPKDQSERKSRFLTFRARDGLHERLADAAAKAERSISEEIERRLEHSFERELRVTELEDRVKLSDDLLRRFASGQTPFIIVDYLNNSEQSEQKTEANKQNPDETK